MLSRLRALYHDVVANTQAIKRLDSAAFNQPGMSPIDRHIAIQAATRRDGLFSPSYEPWRATRINKMLQIYGLEWFPGKRIVELGCGHADLGAFFAELGSEVLSIDGRTENVVFAKLKHRHISNLQIQVGDLDDVFPSGVANCDLLVHFGLLYHLRNVDEHLAQCWKLADDIVLETVVCDSLDPHYIVYFEGDQTINEEALNGRQNRPSPFYIERLAVTAGYQIERFFTSDLNSGIFVYDWEHKNNGDLGGRGGWRKRRMWRFHRGPVFESNPRISGAFSSIGDA